MLIHFSIFFIIFFVIALFNLPGVKKKANETKRKTFGEDGNDSPPTTEVPGQTFNKRREQILRKKHETEKKKK